MGTTLNLFSSKIFYILYSYYQYKFQLNSKIMGKECINEAFEIIFKNSTNWITEYRLQMDPCEIITCLKEVALSVYPGSETTSYISIGTVRTFGEDSLCSGRIIIIELNYLLPNKRKKINIK